MRHYEVQKWIRNYDLHVAVVRNSRVGLVYAKNDVRKQVINYKPSRALWKEAYSYNANHKIRLQAQLVVLFQRASDARTYVVQIAVNNKPVVKMAPLHLWTRLPQVADELSSGNCCACIYDSFNSRKESLITYLLQELFFLSLCSIFRYFLFCFC